MYLDYLQIWIEYLLDRNPAADAATAPGTLALNAIAPFSPEPHAEN